MTLDLLTAARRRTRRLTWAVLCIALVLAGVAIPTSLGRTANTGSGSGSGSGDPHPMPSPVGSPSAVTPSVSGATGGLPPDVTWRRIMGVDLPYAASTGPAESAGGRARGFARTQAGAVVAALHLVVRTTPEVGPAVFEPTLREQVVGADADLMRQVVADTYTQTAAQLGIPYGQVLGELPATFAGVRVQRFSADAAQMSLLTSALDATGVTRYAATTVQVSFVDGDWRLVAPPQGRWDSQVRIVGADSVSDYPPLRTG